MSIWDNPEFKSEGTSSTYVNFKTIGDSVEGTVLSVGLQTWDDGTIAPKIILHTSEGERTLTAGQVRLKMALAEKRPEQGDYLAVKFVSIEDRGGGKTLKHFDVAVRKAMATAPF
jgi:hypothetical protein